MTKHITYFDFLRGIAILMVVGIHTFPSASWDKLNDVLLIVIRQLLNCAVPIFLAISAFFIANKKFETFTDVKAFWKKQIPKVYIPCLVWSIPYLVLDICSGSNLLKSGINFFFCGYSIYYFIALIIQFYLLTPLLVKINNFFWGVVLSLISILSISLYVYSELQLPLILYAGPFLVWIMFYIQGVFMSRMKRNYSSWGLLLLLILCFLLQIYESKNLFELNGRGMGIKATAYLYSSVAIFLLFSQKLQNLYQTKTNLIFRTIEYIGRISFSIYLIHMFVILLVNRYMEMHNWILNWSVILVLTILIIKMLKIFLPTRFAGRYLGIL